MKSPLRILGFIAGALIAGILVHVLCAECLNYDSSKSAKGFTRSELAILNNADSIMRVLTIEDPQDLAVLRSRSQDFSCEALLSDEFRRLSELMVATVTHPSQDGVGIAGPQVGLNRRVVAVQRFDKEGEPFEVYPNIRIVWQSDSLEFGPEGCLSVPDRREDVARSTEIIIEYTGIDPESKPSSQGNPPSAPTLIPVRDTVSGFTAVIFQHEVDHLDGILYIDRL